MSHFILLWVTTFNKTWSLHVFYLPLHSVRLCRNPRYSQRTFSLSSKIRHRSSLNSTEINLKKTIAILTLLPQISLAVLLRWRALLSFAVSYLLMIKIFIWVPLGSAPTWRLLTKVCKASPNNARMKKRTDLNFGNVVYIFHHLLYPIFLTNLLNESLTIFLWRQWQQALYYYSKLY